MNGEHCCCERGSHQPCKAGEAESAGAAVLSSGELFRHANTVRIEHAGQVYQLRLTRENKLILTK